MADVQWLLKRLGAMSISEIIWRLSQKRICLYEKSIFGKKKISVANNLFNNKYKKLKAQAEKLHLNLNNDNYILNTSIPLFCYDYNDYKYKWNAGFQTENIWPDKFSYSLNYKQRDDIGDARTNWELNRHFQFALLAKNYYASKDKRYLDEFMALFEDWNNKNPFLTGISWTSVMEIAIRCSNWCYAYCFLNNTDAPERLLEKLHIGILNMTEYITKHYSRFSSANNHLIVEAYAIGQSGILFDHKPWIDFSVDILTKELTIQNYSDGVNKEMSLHYQSFYMEAMGLMMRLMIKNNISIPNNWYSMLDKMCRYVADCMGEYGEIVEFGDNDEGKILDLYGENNLLADAQCSHYKYVLGIFSILLDKQYIDIKGLDCENLNWLFTENEIKKTSEKILYEKPLFACYKEGGSTILRSVDKRILIGIDHGALGFGSIAAHGHADALSFQMYADGIPVFVDPGTYIYHCDIESRNAFRKTENHNTVCIDGMNQSEMLGAFLWGRKAESNLIKHEELNEILTLTARHNGYRPLLHTREYRFNFTNELIIKDYFSETTNAVISFLFSPKTEIDIHKKNILFKNNTINGNLDLSANKEFNIKTEYTHYSASYGIKIKTKVVRIYTYTDRFITVINFGLKRST